MSKKMSNFLIIENKWPLKTKRMALVMLRKLVKAVIIRVKCCPSPGRLCFYTLLMKR